MKTVDIRTEYEPYYSNSEIPKCGFMTLRYYKDTLKWENGEKVFAIGIVMKKRYASGFIENGLIKFGSAFEWSKYAQDATTGRGDLLEGVFEAYKLEEIDKIREGIKNNPGSYPVRILSEKSDLIYLKDSQVLKLPVFCFYMIKCKDMILKDCNDHIEAQVHIPARYFRGLADDKNWKEESKLPVEEQHVLIMVYNPSLFIDKIYETLIEHGINEEDIILKSIQYENLDIPFRINCNHPMELFIKHMQFSDQKEGRIVLNIKDNKKADWFTHNTISIGSLKDIIVLHDHYYAGGLWINYMLEKQ